MNSKLVPALYRNAETAMPEVDRWCDAVLNGVPAHLLLLGPSRSGKTHTAFAALRRLLETGYGRHRIASYDALSLPAEYSGEIIDEGPPVIFLDNLTMRIDITEGVAGLAEDEDPHIQAELARRRANTADVAARLAARTEASWIACASNASRLATAVGSNVAGRILDLAEVVELPARPRVEHSW